MTLVIRSELVVAYLSSSRHFEKTKDLLCLDGTQRSFVTEINRLSVRTVFAHIREWTSLSHFPVILRILVSKIGKLKKIRLGVSQFMTAK